MRKIKNYLVVGFILCVINIGVLSHTYAENTENYNDCDTITIGNLTLISYSDNWKGDKLHVLYNELLNNVHGQEINCLKKILIYDNSPYGVNGLYYDDIYMGDDGKYVCGDNAYIELFNADRYDTVEKIAPVLAHEYGHHYTMNNITKRENLYYSNWANSEYGRIRDLKSYPVNYTQQDKGYVYRWDVTEIAAEDYVQFFGSSLARASTKYTDIEQRGESGLGENYSDTDVFNLVPQENKTLPLAAEVKGLYEYLLSIGGFTSRYEVMRIRPQITDIVYTENGKYKILWSKAEGKAPFEYTLIMYPKGNPDTPIPIKTVSEGEKTEAYIGEYSGEYDFRVFVKDRLRFVSSSEIYNVDLDYIKNGEDNSEKMTMSDILNTIFIF